MFQTVSLQSALATFGLGFGTVFVGLICLILIISLMSLIYGKVAGKAKPEKEQAPAAAPVAPAQTVANRGEFIAAVSAAIATEMGTDVTGLKIVSIKKIG